MKIQMRARARVSQGGGTRVRAAEYRIRVNGGPWRSFPTDAAMMRAIRSEEKAARQRGERVEFEHV
jgi:hypothetical protein